MNGAAQFEVRPLAVGGIDFSADFQGESKTCAIAEGETGVFREGSKVGSKTGLGFGEWCNPREEIKDRVDAWITGQPKVEELCPDLGVVGRADDSTFDHIEDADVDVFIPEDRD